MTVSRYCVIIQIKQITIYQPLEPLDHLTFIMTVHHFSCTCRHWYSYLGCYIYMGHVKVKGFLLTLTILLENDKILFSTYLYTSKYCNSKSKTHFSIRFSVFYFKIISLKLSIRSFK